MLEKLYNFNPHSHEGSDATFRCYISKVQISIHTPTKGATFPCLVLAKRFVISIHTPTKGATSWNLSSGSLFRYFNPHSHEGSDVFTCVIALFVSLFQSTLPRRERRCRDRPGTYSKRISIHTPTKGATAILTNNFLIFCSISLINFALYLKIIQILFIFRYKFIFYFIF